jgi:hypothetical protein
MDRWIRPFGARRERLEKGVDEDCQRKDKDKQEKLEREERERVSYAQPPSSGRTSTMQLGPLIGSWFFFFLISPFFLI